MATQLISNYLIHKVNLIGMHGIQDTSVFAIYAEVQDGHKKWQENDFCKKSPVDSAGTLGSKISSKSL